VGAGAGAGGVLEPRPDPGGTAVIAVDGARCMSMRRSDGMRRYVYETS